MLSPYAYALAQPKTAEAQATARVLAAAAAADEAPVYLVNLACREALAEVRAARARGQRRIFVDTCPQYLLLDSCLLYTSYFEMDTTESVTEMLKAAFEKSGPLSQYNQELTERTVSSISLNHDGRICLTLKNGRKIRKENRYGTDCRNASKKNPHNAADNSAVQCV